VPISVNKNSESGARKNATMMISTVVMFQAQNRETINSTLKVMSFKIIMTTSVTRSYFTKQHQNCKTKTKTKTAITHSVAR